MEAPEARKVLRILRRMYAKTLQKKRAGWEVDPFRILVMTILSAQTTDNAVDRVKGALFSAYPDPASLARAGLPEIEAIVHSLGFYRVKARHVRDTARMLVDRFGGRVPDTMEELLLLPGVGRKTANIVLNHAFGRNEGVAVDTHVKRLSWRLGFSDARAQEAIERDLAALFPRKAWGELTDLLIAHGRRLCTAKSPLCAECPLREHCRYYAIRSGGPQRKR